MVPPIDITLSLLVVSFCGAVLYGIALVTDSF